MFLAALFTITKIWKQPKCPSVDEWIKYLWDTYTMDYYLDIKNKRRKNFTLCNSMDGFGEHQNHLSEISTSEKDKYHMISLTCRI